MTSYQTEQHTQALERMVRETGYNLVRIEASGDRGETYSRARCLYDQAVNLLRIWAQIHKATERANDFIARTYGQEVTQ